MSALILDGKTVASALRDTITQEVRTRTEHTSRPPVLAAVQVGENPASTLYTNMQARDCETVGIRYELRTLDEQTTQDELLAHIEDLNGDPAIDAIILQMPLPAHLDAREAQCAIKPGKDVEGIHPANLGALFYWKPGAGLAPCTPRAAMELLALAVTKLGWGSLAGKQAVVVGHSEIVGKPLTMMLLASPRSAPTVSACHIATADLAAHTREADVLIVAAGVSQARHRAWKRAGSPFPPPTLSPLITAAMVKPGAIVIDVATNRIPKGFDDAGDPLRNEKGKLAMQTVGDVDFEAVRDIAAAITPVPGGVGPVTVAMLLQNVLRCATP